MDSDSSSASTYIHLVQHLIEECIVFNMSMEECTEALSKHANINPVITSTVWKELEKENKEFFEAYAKRSREQKQVAGGGGGLSSSPYYFHQHHARRQDRSAHKITLSLMHLSPSDSTSPSSSSSSEDDVVLLKVLRPRSV